MTFQVYEFTAYDPNADKEFTFKGYQMPGGEVLIPEEQTHDSFYENLDAVEGHSSDEIKGFESTGKTVNFTEDELRESVSGAAEEFGKEAIPASLQYLLN